MAEDYRRRLDNNVESLVENFRGLVTMSKIKDRTQTSRQALQSSVYATTLVHASESLLKLIAELKLSLTLNDFEGINQQVDATSESLKEKYVASALFELENHYYQSKWRVQQDI
ncbi:Mediator of RNA polymerase II transcription subunit 22 [Aphanomyces cochlioides]|nr:Mediator of RNA polymerase II transcription subunit 22 [Aphanomyces cochlioides]